jgi:hypothetical protein
LIGYENSLVAPLREQSLIRSTWKHLPLNEHVVTDRSGQQRLIWSFYSVGTRVFASGLRAQLWYGAQSLLDMPESRVIALRTSCLRECQQARETLGNFLEQAEWLSAPLPRSSRILRGRTVGSASEQ